MARIFGIIFFSMRHYFTPYKLWIYIISVISETKNNSNVTQWIQSGNNKSSNAHKMYSDKQKKILFYQIIIILLNCYGFVLTRTWVRIEGASKIYCVE